MSQNITKKLQNKISGDRFIFGCYAVLLSEQLQTLRVILVPSKYRLTIYQSTWRQVPE
jgi:hypothetical protein